MARRVLIKMAEQADETGRDQPREVSSVVRKEQCPQCKGNRFISVVKSPQRESWVKCPSCGGQGFKIRIQSR